MIMLTDTDICAILFYTFCPVLPLFPFFPRDHKQFLLPAKMSEFKLSRNVPPPLFT